MAGKIQSSDIKISSFISSDIDDLQSFCCGCKELDNYIKSNLLICAENHYISAYTVRLKSSSDLIAVFTLANDALIIQSDEDKKDVIADSPIISDSNYADYFMKQTSFPAINIAHLAVDEKWQSCGVGRVILDVIIGTYANFKSSGCQFITVDAINNNRVMKFYTINNGFIPLTVYDMNNSTRRLYLPLEVFK